jgi:hypothetical protein
MTHTRRQFARYVRLTVTLLFALTTAARSEPPQDEFRRLVHSDWQSQEKRWGRKPEDLESIRQALSRGERLSHHLSNVAGGLDVAREVAELEELRRQIEDLRTLKDHQRLALYRQIRSLTRSDEAEVVLADVQVSHQALPAARPIAQLRIFQVLPKSETHVANQPRLGYANAESARLDGNAAFYGTYREQTRLAQQRGKRVPEPALQ